MPDFNVRSDSVNVEQIMEQIRARIREKRGVDYTEQQIRELAAVKLEKFLDPRGVRSDLLDQFRKAQPAYEPPELPNFAFEDATLFESHRAPIRWIRELLMPLLKLLFNPNPLIQALHIQSRLNTINAERDARAGGRPPADGSAVLRAGAQPRRRNDADGHRGQEPQDARRVDLEPARVQRTPRARARRRRRLQDGGGGGTAGTACAAAGAAVGSSRRRANSSRDIRRRPCRTRAGSAGAAGIEPQRRPRLSNAGASTWTAAGTGQPRACLAKDRVSEAGGGGDDADDVVAERRRP